MNTDAHGRTRQYTALALAALLLFTAPAGAATAVTGSAQELPSTPAFVVALDADGSARVAVTTPFNLSNDDQQQAFESLRQNETARERQTERFADRMAAIVANAERESGREMAVSDPAMSFTERGGVGTVALSVRWKGLAAVDGETLVLREPFDSGFEVDRTFRVVGPDGSELAAVTPSPDQREPNSATWAPSSNVDGFVATFEPAGTAGSDSSSPTGTETSAPGFGSVTALIAIVTTAGVGATRRRRRE